MTRRRRPPSPRLVETLSATPAGPDAPSAAAALTLAAPRWPGFELAALLLATLVVAGWSALAVDGPHYQWVLDVAYQVPLTALDQALLVVCLWTKSWPAWLACLLAGGLVCGLGWVRLGWLVWGLTAAGHLFWLTADAFVARRFGMHAWAYLEFATNAANPLEWVGEDTGLLLRVVGYAVGSLAIVSLAGLVSRWVVGRRQIPPTAGPLGRARWLGGAVLALAPVALTYPLGLAFSSPAVVERLLPALPVTSLWLARPAPSSPELAAFAHEVEARLAPTVSRLAPLWGVPAPAETGGPAPPNRPPHVVIVVLESFRHNVVTPEVMPRLSAWSRTGLKLARHYAGSNRSQYGIYGLLYGRHPLTYAAAIVGSVPPPLCISFAAAGYRTHYLASARTEWALMDAFINRRTFAHLEIDDHGDWPGRDRRVLARIPRLLAEAGDEPRLVVAFLMSTHYNYQYPPEFARFEPATQFGGVTDFVADDWQRPEDRAGLLNRYQNAAAFLDDELGRLRDQLDPQRTLVVITGDHGESLFEDGTLTHSSRLSEIQLRVPCCLIGPGLPTGEIPSATTHADLLPTLLAAALQRRQPAPFAYGRNLLAPFSPVDQVLLFQGNYGQPPELLWIRGPQRLHLTATRELDQLSVRGAIDELARPLGDPPPSVAEREALTDELAAELSRALGGPSAVAYLEATRAVSQGDRAGYERALEQAVAAEPVVPAAFNDLAWHLAEQSPGQLARALELVNQALALAPGNLSYLDTRAEIQLRRRDWPAAYRDLQALERARPGDPRRAALLARVRAQLRPAEAPSKTAPPRPADATRP